MRNVSSVLLLLLLLPRVGFGPIKWLACPSWPKNTQLWLWSVCRTSLSRQNSDLSDRITVVRSLRPRVREEETARNEANWLVPHWTRKTGNSTHLYRTVRLLWAWEPELLPGSFLYVVDPICHHQQEKNVTFLLVRSDLKWSALVALYWTIWVPLFLSSPFPEELWAWKSIGLETSWSIHLLGSSVLS